MRHIRDRDPHTPAVFVLRVVIGRGRDALDGVVLMDMGLAQYREHMTPTMRMHRVITEGGHQPNVVPRKAAVWWYFRDSTAEGAGKLFDQAKKVAKAPR